MRQVFPELVPRRSWRQVERSVKVGDVCLLKSLCKFAAPTYRLCRVVEDKQDEHGVVWTVMVELRGKHKDSGVPAYTSRRVKAIEVGIQRLAVILPVEEQIQERAQEQLVGAKEPDVNHTCTNCSCILT